jgi:hypothetical protein
MIGVQTRAASCDLCTRQRWTASPYPGITRAGSLLLRALIAIGLCGLQPPTVSDFMSVGSDVESVPTLIGTESALGDCFRALAAGAFLFPSSHACVWCS